MNGVANRKSSSIARGPESADFLFTLDLRRVCKWAFYSIRSSTNSQMTLRFLFARFHDQTANGGCDQDSKEDPPLENTTTKKKSRVQPVNVKTESLNILLRLKTRAGK